ncbi:hypothetical protein EDM80_12765 [bacterium]|nr:MAG: hypothetical protein EDM80_12765 [bacterium]
MIAMVFAAYGFYQSKSYRNEAEAIYARLEEDHKQFEPLHTQIKEVAEVTGCFVKGDPDQFITAASSEIKGKPPNSEEEQKGADANPVYRRWRDADRLYFGEGDKGGMVHSYVSARRFLDKLELAVKKWIAYKAYQVYTVKTIISSEISDEAYLPDETAIEAAYTKWTGGDQPADRAMKPRNAITLENILRLQMLLLDELITANVRQYGLLVGEITGDDEVEGRKVGVGRFAEEERAKAIIADVDRKVGDNRERGRLAERAINETAEADGELSNLALENERNFTDEFLIRDNQIKEDATKFEAEKLAHEADRKAFVEVVKRIARIKQQVPVKRADADGRITYSDDRRKSLHIDLGRLDGVKAGQRFEVWRYDGFEKDAMLGVIEIVRTLSDYTSLCTVLELSDENTPIRKGDAIVSRIWHNGRFLSVALHGTYEPPKVAYSRERLTELLKQAGVRVVEKVQPGTDIVVTGSDLYNDNWYRQARDSLRLETISEEEIRLYVDPR